MSDDAYEPALEMESTAEPTDAADDVGDANDAPVTQQPRGSTEAPPVEPQSKYRQRELSEKTRASIAAIAKQAAKEGFAAGEDLVPVEHDSQPAAAGAAAAEPAAKRASPAATSPSLPAAAAVAPDEADLEPSISDDEPAVESAHDIARAISEQNRIDTEAREKLYAEREAALEAREKALPSRADIIERPAHALSAYLKSVYEITDDKEFQDVIVDLVTDLSESVLGVKIPGDTKLAMESRRAVRSVKAYKADLTQQQKKLAEDRAAAEQAAVKAREEAEQAANERKAVAQVTKLLTDAKAEYPFLFAKENAGGILLDVIREQKAKGLPVDWQRDAALANNYFKKEAEATVQKAARLKTLLAPAAPAAPAKATASPGAAPGPAAKPQPKPEPVATAEEEPAHEDRHERRARKARELARRFSAQANASD